MAFELKSLGSDPADPGFRAPFVADIKEVLHNEIRTMIFVGHFTKFAAKNATKMLFCKAVS